MASLFVLAHGIAAGREVEGRREAPYFVQVLDPIACGGTIIGKRFVLTSAHCQPTVARTRIVYSSGDRTNGREWELPVSGVAQMPYSNVKDVGRDLALLYFNEDLPHWKGLMEPIRLGIQVPYLGSKCSVFGYGDVEFGGERSEQLKVANLFTKKCEFSHANKADRICTKPAPSGAWGTPCSGDSGGGLVFESRLVGILSSGDSTTNIECTRDATTYFASVPANRVWLEGALHSFGSSLESLAAEFDTPRFSTKRFRFEVGGRDFATRAESEAARARILNQQSLKSTLVNARWHIRSIRVYSTEEAAQAFAEGKFRPFKVVQE